MKKLLLVVIAVFLMAGVAGAEPAGNLNIENVIEAEFKTQPKKILYKKNKDGKSTIYIEFEKPV